MNSLLKRSVEGILQLAVGMAVLIFLPAWSLSYWQGWRYLALFAGSACLITVYLWKHDPALLERRVKAGPGAESQKSQKIIQAVASLAFIGLLVIPALDHHFGWSSIPLPGVFIGDALVILGFYGIFRVFKANTFTAGTIEIAKNQKVISTGPYAWVRHPMYANALIMMFGTPLALGSSVGLLMFIPMVAGIIWRLSDEEKFLTGHLNGYTEYRSKVKFRLIPFLW
jgi:protein-S-isoprenylcysteine O-methyltransferase Ste14